MEEAKPKIRRRHAGDLKHKVLGECSVPGVSVAKVALAHGLNANLVHKWRREASRSQAPAVGPTSAMTQARHFVPVTMPPAAQPLGDIRIDVRRGATTITVAWPMAAAAECASWMRELLR
jgi:transposase